MRVLTFLICLFFCQFLYADCLKNICKNDIVRDIFGWKGTVVAFDLAAANVQVQLHHNGFVYPFPVDELGKLVSCYKQFCQGQRLVDSYGSDIIIEEVYTHEMLYAFNLNTDGYALYQFSELDL